MEKIINIEIKNFKSIRHQKIDGCKRINVFVGKPNVGKSNILEALSLFCLQNNIKDGINLKDVIRVTTDSTIFFDGEVNSKLEIKINDDFVVEGIYESGIFELRFGLLNFEAIERNAKNHSISSIPFFYEWCKLKDFKFYSGEHFFKNHLKLSYPQPKKYDFRKEINYKEGDFKRLSYPFGYNLFSVIQNNISLRKEFSEIARNYDLELFFNQTKQSFSLFKKTEAGFFEVSWDLIADTLQRLFFYRTAIKTNNNTTLLLEEPESHMYPPYISKFTSDIILDENDNQYFIATHSPYVLNDFMEDAKDELSIYLVDYKNGETIVYRLDDEEMHIAYQFGHDFFMNIENFIPHTAHEKV